MAVHFHHLPPIIYNNAAWFFYMSNALEMDRVKADTAKRAQVSENASRNKRKAVLRLPARR